MFKMTQRELRLWNPPLNAVIITDLDGCAVDSSHRQNTNPDGTLNLEEWRKHSTPELIAKDTLTPWGERIQELARRCDLTFAVCTSRVVQDADLKFIAQKFGIQRFSELIWTRPKTCLLSDAELKLKLFTSPKTICRNERLTEALNLGKLFFVDDLEPNCRVAEQLGLQAIQAK